MISGFGEDDMKTLIVLPLWLTACADKEGDTSGDSGGVAAVCSEPAEITCEDTMVQDLSFQETVSEGEVTTTADGADYVTLIDASAGGFGHEDENPWVYVKFTEDGAVKAEISDEDALESMDWHLSARRFILRLNGGDSGPSCVGAATLLDGNYDSVSEVPEDVSYVVDDYYTDDCTLINDSSGLPDSPQVALGAWWEYPGCVATTATPFLVQLADGHVLKLVVEGYYQTDQETCNETGSPPSAGGYIQIRWRFLL